MAMALQKRPRRVEESPRSSLVTHTVVVAGRRTSVRLEPVMWDALSDIARRRQATVNQIVTEIDWTRTESSLTAAIRVYIVNYYRRAAAMAPERLRAAPLRA